MSSILRLLLATLCLVSAFNQAKADELTVSAAISLKEVLEESIKLYETTIKDKVTLNLGASGALAQQIVNGAPVDLYIAAANEPMALLEKQSKIVAPSKKVLARNALVLVAPLGRKDLVSFKDLGSDSVRRIAVGDPKTVPAGQYAEEVLRKLALDQTVTSKLIFGNNVRQVLTYVETNNVDAGIVYATDALSSTKVRLVAQAEAAWHEPIVYPMAVIGASKHKGAATRLATFLAGPDVAKILAKHGFFVGDLKAP